MPMAGRKFYGTKAPSVAQRRMRAVLFLVNSPSLEGITAATLVRRFDLKPAVAQELLGKAKHA